ncbi:hypothetical protein G9A89_011841 [Geosiphon pyriformis]|nr:hypothetical protein G9A89_011841 [Geosiphon pyriformis]
MSSRENFDLCVLGRIKVEYQQDNSNFFPIEKKKMVYHKAIVKSVLSGDTVILRGKANQSTLEKQLSLAYVEAPRLKLGPNSKTDDEPFAFDSREFLRRLLVGKEVSFCIAYTTPNSREYGSIFLNNGENVTFQALREGWVKVRERKNKGDSSVDELEVLSVIEKAAQDAQKGIWGDKEKASRVVNYNLQGDTADFLKKYKKTPINGIVEQVRDASTLRVLLLLEPPEPQQHISLMLSGVKAPTVRKGIPDAEDLVEPFGEKAKFFVESKLLQRDVKVILEGQSGNNQALVGTVLLPGSNIAEDLVSNGLAKVVDWSIMLVTDGPVKLRTAEAVAKEQRLGIWEDHVARSKAGGEDHEFDGIVTKIISGDTLQIKVIRSGVEKKLQLSSIRQPKPKDPKVPEYNYEAKEFLRKRLIGKTVHVIIDYAKPPQDNFEERECATVKLGETNIAEKLVENGLAHVVRHKKDDEDRSSSYDQLLIAEQKAINNAKRIHNGKEPPVYKISDASETAAKARQFLHSFQRSGRIAAMVDHVANGSRFKIYIPKDNCKLTFLLSGIRCPRLGRSSSEKSEPFALEAVEFANHKTLQRDVEIEIENVDKTGGFIGTLWLNKSENFAVSLLEEGLSTIHEYSADQSPYTNQLYGAEKSAKASRKNIWSQDPDSVQVGEDLPASEEKEPQKEYVDVIVSEILSGGHFYVQIMEGSVHALERLMSEFSLYHKNSADNSHEQFQPRVNEIVSAKFTEDDQWYRARIKGFSPEAKTVDVTYIDYGNGETIPLSRTRPIPPNFSQLPPQSHEAVLSFLKVPAKEEDYGEEAYERFRDLAHNKQLVANIDFVDNKVRHLTLYDPRISQSPEMSLNAELVRDGLALVDKKLRYVRVNSSIVKKLSEAQEQAKKDRLGMFEYGDVTVDEDEDKVKRKY